MPNSTLKVAIIRLSSLGDIISTLVFLEFLRAKFLESRRKIDITFIVDSQFRAILENSPLVDKIIDLPLRESKKNKKLLWQIYRQVRSLGRFDIVIDAQGLLKSALIGKFLKKGVFIGYDKDSIREKIASFFYDKKAQIPYNEHILKRQYTLFKVAFNDLPLAQDFDLKMLDSRNLALTFSSNAKAKIAELLAPYAKSSPKILFLIETSKENKEFSLDSFENLARILWSDFPNAKIFLIWDKKELEIRALGVKDSRFCVLPRLNLDEIKALLAQIDLVIGGDTGITHMAWAMKIQSITIYISTNMARFRLDGKKHISLDLSDFALDSPQIIETICQSAKDLLK